MKAPTDYMDIMVIATMILVVVLNIVVVNANIKKALRKFILPQLEKNNLKYKGYEWLGPFGTGDFKRKFTFIIMSSPEKSIYISVFFTAENNITQRITARIDTRFSIVRNVVFSRELSS